jgi:hypothetical protein
MEPNMSHIIYENTDVQALVGQTFSTENFGPFEILAATQAPELSAMAYTARGVDDGLLFFAFLPWGKELFH